MPVASPSSTPITPGTQASANDLISSAMRLLNMTASGENPSGNEVNDAWSVLNQMLDEWNAERLMIFTINRTVLVPASLKQAYTLGVGGDFNIARPPKIEMVSVLNLANPAAPTELELDYLTDPQWRAIPVKNVSSALPTKVWDDGGFPQRTLSFFPIPNVQVNFVIYVWGALTQFTDLVTPLSFPPAYLKALRFNLAVDLAAEFGKDVPAAVGAIAQSTKAKIKTMNVPIIELKGDGALTGTGGGYNWLTDTPVMR